ncbi:MAG: fumarylacetoacetate hydrolase family protein [Chloroflexi bacterium]|nr:fumarylacetoacetate hydrolase family protein [Chloroflexota bacterium]
MKLVTFEKQAGELRLGAWHGEAGAARDPAQGGVIVDLAAAAEASGATQDVPALASAIALLRAGEAGQDAALQALRFAQERGIDGTQWSVAPSAVRLRAPIPRPGKVLALAGNYAAHRAEGGVKSPLAEKALPEVFCKPATAVIGHGEAIQIPGLPVATVDYEGELGVVIGRPCRRVAQEDALSYVGGYVCANDVSGRKLDPGFERDPDILDRAKFFDWLIGKWPDTFCPLGPWLVTADEIPDPMALKLVTRVNGEQRQETITGEMIHTIARTIAWCSSLMTLEPGDVIAMGTPAGVGSARGVFLQPGDVVEVEIERIGVLRNPVEAAAQ